MSENFLSSLRNLVHPSVDDPGSHDASSGANGSPAFAGAFHAKLADQKIADDPGQHAIIDALIDLGAALDTRRSEPAQGLYIWGRVGRGKSMLMTMFFETVATRRKTHVHFHAFMADVHVRLQRRQTSSDHSDDPIAGVVAEIAAEARLLCLDELEITDIGDAVIVGRLFEQLFAAGVVIVATSNDQPDALYHGGPNHEAFEPFVAELKRHMAVVELAGEHDHREDHQKDGRRYFCPLSDATRAAFDAAWSQAIDGASERPQEVAIHGRSTRYTRASGNRVRATFDELCARALSAEDHLAFAGQFGDVFLEGVPQLVPDQHDEARRLVTLVDALYEAKCRLVVLAAAEPDALFAGFDTEDTRRTASRLKEMESADWQATESRIEPA